MTPKAAGAKPLPVDNGKYLGVLKKQADGSWKYLFDTWNSDAPPAR
jgi:ketosteroid isomerase-like protein